MVGTVSRQDIQKIVELVDVHFLLIIHVTLPGCNTWRQTSSKFRLFFGSFVLKVMTFIVIKKLPSPYVIWTLSILVIFDDLRHYHDVTESILVQWVGIMRFVGVNSVIIEGYDLWLELRVSKLQVFQYDPTLSRATQLLLLIFRMGNNKSSSHHQL